MSTLSVKIKTLESKLASPITSADKQKRQEKIQKQIDTLEKKGNIFEKESVGRSLSDGIYCGICGKNYAGTNIYAYKPNEKSEDPMSQLLCVIGSECFKLLKFHGKLQT